jgi:hypothetical protein
MESCVIFFNLLLLGRMLLRILRGIQFPHSQGALSMTGAAVRREAFRRDRTRSVGGPSGAFIAKREAVAVIA